MPATRVRKSQELRDLVECLTGRVVASGAQHTVFTPGGNIDQQRVPARNQQRGERRYGVRMLERLREEVPLHVVHTDDRLSRAVGEPLGVTHPDEQRAHQPRCIGHCNDIDVRQAHGGLAEGLLDDWHDGGDVRAGCDLRHYAAEDAVHVLREDHE